jgi:phi13 family phage major tail protein
MPKDITIGLDMFHYAVMTDESTETYDVPVHVPGLIQMNVSPTVNSVNLSADDKIYDTADSLGAINVTLGLANLPTEDQAALLGHTVNADGVLIRKSTDQAPYVAVGYRRRMSNGKYRYVWLYKGKFRVYDQNADTKGETPTYQTPSISATFMPRDKDNQWQAVANEGDPGIPSQTLADWFDAVYEETPDVTPLTVTVDPLHEATEVDVEKIIKWTFNKAINTLTINSANFFLLDSDNSPVAGTLDYNSTQKEITFTPTSSLSAGTYIAFATLGVKDVSGKSLATASITTFTVGA